MKRTPHFFILLTILFSLLTSSVVSAQNGVIPAPAPVTTVPSPAPPPPEKKEKKKADLKDMLSWEVHLHGGWELKNRPEDGQSNISNEFYVGKARLKLSAEPLEWLKGVIQIDAADATSGNLLKDAYIHLSPLRFLQLRVGQFKKPYSGLRLTSAEKLRLINRGEGNDSLVEDLRYGDRDLGIQLSGVIIESIKLEYAAGAFNGSGPNIGDNGNSKDLVFRLETAPHKSIRIGANGSIKFIEDAATDRGQPDVGQAWGLDTALRLKGFRAFAQALFGIDHQLYNFLELDAEDPPWIFNIIGVLAYQHDFDTRVKFAVEPAVQFEYLDPQLKVVDDGVYVLTAGINTYVSPFFRVMLNGEFEWTSRNTLSSHYKEGEKLMVLLCLDI